MNKDDKFKNDPRITMANKMWIEDLQIELHRAKQNNEDFVTVRVTDLEAVLKIVSFIPKK